MRYLVTGGAGFIGSNIVDELVRRGQDVVVLDDLSSGKEENLAALRSQVDLRIGTIADLAAVQSACSGIDYVIHLAARTSVPRSVANPLETNRVNIDGTLNVLVAARDAKVRRLVFAASSSAYGETAELPKTESMSASPISPYGVTKLAGELYAQVFGRAYGLENVSLRYFNLHYYKEPHPYYNHDVAVIGAKNSACIAALELWWTGARVTLNQVIKLLEKITGKKITAEYDPPRIGDIKDSQADISLARKVLGYQPTVNFEEGLKLTWDWYASTYHKT